MRLLWIVNHQTLIDAELPILHEIGLDVFVPKRIPQREAFRSGATTRAYDSSLGLPRTELDLLNEADFFGPSMPPCIQDVVSRRFDLVVCSLSHFQAPMLISICNFFEGIIVARAFGREHPRTYAEYYETVGQLEAAREAVLSCGKRFVFAPAYQPIVDVEPSFLASGAQVIGVPMSNQWLALTETWSGGASGDAIVCCPYINVDTYYRDLYLRVTQAFEQLPLKIFGSQPTVVNDERVLPYLSSEALEQLFQQAAVYLYPSEEPRHVHYSVLEAIAVGTPTLVLKGSLIASMIPEDSPSICMDLADMAIKAQHIIDGSDRAFTESVRRSNHVVLREFEPARIRDQWEGLLRRSTAVSGWDVRSPNEGSSPNAQELRVAKEQIVRYPSAASSYGTSRIGR